MSTAVPRLYFLDVPEYRPFIEVLGRDTALRREEAGGYVRFSGEGQITVRRADTGLGEAVWFGALVAGFEGRVVRFTDEELVVA